jgi:small subunit ribosomal protein S5
MPDQKTTQSSRPQGQGRRPQNGQNPGEREEKIFEEYVISIDRVARVVKGGRRFRFKALVVVGDKKNRIGVGVAKGGDVQSSVAKAIDVAKKSLVTFPMMNGTIPHEVEAKVAGARILLKPAAPGTGLIAGGVVRSMMGLTGAHNLLSKSLGSTNKVNSAYATIAALKMLVPAKDWVTTKNAPKKTAKAADAKEEK